MVATCPTLHSIFEDAIAFRVLELVMAPIVHLVQDTTIACTPLLEALLVVTPF